MKKLSATVCLLFLLTGLAHAAFGIFQTYAPAASGPINMGGGPSLIERSLFSSNAPNLTPSQWYTPGNGSPAVSTSDYYLMSGLVYSKPYDLDTMGAVWNMSAGFIQRMLRRVRDEISFRYR